MNYTTLQGTYRVKGIRELLTQKRYTAAGTSDCTSAPINVPLYLQWWQDGLREVADYYKLTEHGTSNPARARFPYYIHPYYHVIHQLLMVVWRGGERISMDVM